MVTHSTQMCNVMYETICTEQYGKHTNVVNYMVVVYLLYSSRRKRRAIIAGGLRSRVEREESRKEGRRGREGRRERERMASKFPQGRLRRVRVRVLVLVLLLEGRPDRRPLCKGTVRRAGAYKLLYSYWGLLPPAYDTFLFIAISEIQLTLDRFRPLPARHQPRPVRRLNCDRAPSPSPVLRRPCCTAGDRLTEDRRKRNGVACRPSARLAPSGLGRNLVEREGTRCRTAGRTDMSGQ